MTGAAATSVTIVPANEASCEDLQAVLGGRGYHSGCWCQRFKIRGREWDQGSPPVDERARPAGWCAVEPRTAYLRLGRVPWVGPSGGQDR
jgi:hypothetical protein